MRIKTVLFDLDGTLLPMDQEKFTKGYFSILVKKVAKLGYQPDKLIKSVWESVEAMIKNDGKINNEEAFWKQFTTIYGEDSIKDKPAFYDFYRNEFNEARIFCGYNEAAKEAIKKIKEYGCKLVLATNPLFPAIATETRIEWAGLDQNDFEFYTTYENCNHCKPNLDYYRGITKRLNINPEECVMVGNDVEEDMVAEKIGMNVFLLTDCLINKKQKDISKYPQGGFSEMLKYVSNLNK